MSHSSVALLTAATTIGSAAVGGIFYAFSSFVMPGLDRTGPTDAATAMRGINAEAQANAPFLALFFGTTVLALVLATVAVVQLGRPGSAFLLAGAVLAILPAVITIVFSVPLNDRLGGGLDWRAYLGPWSWWNHARTITALLGAALLLTGGTTPGR
ncbi:anthrone oxygenase family protein [Mycobacterium sp. BMJ-28]